VRRLLAIVAPLAGLVVASWALTFFSAAAVVAVPACSSSDAGGIEQITGIEVLSSTLTSGHGCGTGPDQIYKYAVVVQIPSNVGGHNLEGDFVAGGVYDCFTDAVFANLCNYLNEDGGAYDVTVFAFNQAQWNGDAGTAGAPAGIVPGLFANQNSYCSGASTNLVPNVPLADLNQYAGWKTTCTAIEQQSIPVLANCLPLQALQP
jgi:hypothetical protein